MRDLELARYERSKPWHELTAKNVASDCIPLGNHGAQSAVFRLPRYFNYDVSPTGNLNDTVEVSRVLRIAHNPQKTEEAIERMNIANPEAKQLKAAKLAADNQVCTTWAIGATRYSHRLEQLLGHPLAVGSPDTSSWRETYHFACTQDFGHPVRDRLAELDTEHNEADLRKACQIVDLYIDAELFLCSRGIFDPTFNLLDNCCMGEHEVLYHTDKNKGFMITDIGELSFYNLPVVIEAIRQKAWRKTADYPEYSPLPPLVRAYFDEAFDARFTEAAVREIWPANLTTDPDAKGADADMADLPIFTKVAAILRWAAA